MYSLFSSFMGGEQKKTTSLPNNHDFVIVTHLDETSFMDAKHELDNLKKTEFDVLQYNEIIKKYSNVTVKHTNESDNVSVHSQHDCVICKHPPEKHPVCYGVDDENTHSIQFCLHYEPSPEPEEQQPPLALEITIPDEHEISLSNNPDGVYSNDNSYFVSPANTEYELCNSLCDCDEPFDYRFDSYGPRNGILSIQQKRMLYLNGTILLFVCTVIPILYRKFHT